MFEKISLKKILNDVPFVPNNYIKKLEMYESELGSSIMNDNILGAFHSDFYIKGDMSVLYPKPVSEYAYTHYLYIQSFTLINALSGYFTKRENFASYLLLFTYKGEGILEYDGKEYLLSKGEGIFIDCRKPHHYFTSDTIWHHSDLHFNGKNAEYFFEEFSKDDSIKFTTHSDDTYQSQLEKLLFHYENASKYKELHVSNVLESLLIYLLENGKIPEKNSNLPEILIDLIKYIDNNFSSPLSLDLLSDFSGISKFHLTRIFKKNTGYSPIEYIIELRLGQAKVLLENTNLPSYRIGEFVGFQNEANFIRQFKKRVNMTPGNYRKLLQSMS